ncbi:uncharacterized protein LOC143595079 [Bidens hawaiensis]|uniref:uncharacterized protein LOC143595079 n=1 Tax=Bidens hawaiensis TaxID=980011 RepID=UPI004049D45D
MSPAKMNSLPESSCSSELSSDRRFGDLRGVQWRIDLGILPSSSSSIEDFRRVTANCRRSYAALRRKILISPPMSRQERNYRGLVMDNPLSQNPDSMWGQFFHKAELERMVDQDLTRLYPEHGSYFQAPERQGVLRRILLLWCIRHPNYGYRQGMHELLAPLLYVLQADLERLSEVRKLYTDYFIDNFDGLSFNIPDSSYNSDTEDEDNNKNQKDDVKPHHLNELDPNVQTIISFSDAYGAEGELGIVLSDKFIEHDAYSMFDVLMNGNEDAVAMASFFSHSLSPENGVPPVIEASSALYRLLSAVDFSLYSHLVELGVEPQYFALRWLRVLFRREFALKDLLVIWDEIFALDNNKLNVGSNSSSKKYEVKFKVFNSLRGAFISAFAVSMILYLRSSILATENATSCLQRLLNFPEDVNLESLIKKAKSLMNLAIDSVNSVLDPVGGPGKLRGHRHSQSSDSTAQAGLRPVVRENYWEEQWRVMNKEEEEEEQNQAGISKQVQNRIRGWSVKVKARLARVARSTVRRNVVNDVTGHSEENTNSSNNKNNNNNNNNNNSNINNNSNNNNNSNVNSNSNNEIESSSVASNSSVNRNELGSDRFLSPSPSIESGMYRSTEDIFSHLPVSHSTEDLTFKEVENEEITKKPVSDLGDTSSPSGKFQWLWKFAKPGPEDPLYQPEAATSSVTEFDQKKALPEAVDHNNLKILAQSMLENIEVIESDENLSENASKALKKLRKIRNILAER